MKTGRRAWFLAAAIAAVAAIGAGSARAPAARSDEASLRGPANGSVWPFLASIQLEDHDPQLCADCDTNVVFRVATDPNMTDVVDEASGTCPAFAAPTCATLANVGPLLPGTYYWARFLTFSNGEEHRSDVWTFTVVPPQAFKNPAVYTDAAGDSSGAPDVQSLAITHDPKTGTIRFAITVPGLKKLADDETVRLFLDTDQNGRTGNRLLRGAEYEVAVTGPMRRVNLWHWDGGSWTNLTTPATAAGFLDGVVFYVTRGNLGDPYFGFNFWIEADKGSGDSATWDLAPDASHWNYQLPQVAAPSPLKIALRTRPAVPRAGKPFRVELASLTVFENRVAPNSVACSGRLAGRALRGSGDDGCTFVLPRAAARKRLSVRVTVTFFEMVESKSLSYVVRP